MEKELKRKLLIVPAVLIGVIIIVVLVKNRAQPEKIALDEVSRAVRVIQVPRLDVIPTVKGTGNVKPSKVWNGVAQVSGIVVETHPRLKNGSIIRADELIVKIDPTDYKIAITQAETNIEAIRAQLAEQKLQKKNDETSLKIEQKALKISKGELKRKRDLLQNGTISRSDVEKEERNVLTQTQSVQSLNNKLNLYEVSRRKLRADLERLQSQLASAKLDLDRTTILMPFTGRIAQSNVELKQFIRLGEVLVIADGISKAEISVQVPMARVSSLMHSEKVVDFFNTEISDLGKVLGITARVMLKSGEATTEWEARVARISDTLDPRTRTVGIIIEVDKPYENVQPGIRPPMLKGAFMNVELRGRPLPNSLVIPRAALHDKQVYLVNNDSRLETRTVEVARADQSFVIIKSGLSEGDRIVVSDIVPAIDGMLLEAIEDKVTLSRLIGEATAQGEGQVP